jgi:diguanylate cyclase (GGDEF)-like protein
MLSAAAFARQLKGLTEDDFALVADSGPITSTTHLGGTELPDGEGGESVSIGGADSRAAALSLDGAPAGTRVVAIVPEEKGFVASEPLVAIVLLAFFALAFLFIVLLLRILQGQVAAMLGAARRIGDGDFSQEVPVEGNDEMAGLAREFNKMSDQLSAQMAELRRQREELDRSVRRIGEAFASGLDRRALLEIVLDTAVAATGAEAGRISFIGRDEPEAEVGEMPTGVAVAMDRAATMAIERSSLTGAEADGAHAIAHPLSGSEDSDRIFGTMALARAGKQFSPDEREVLRYLIGQATVSVENIGLHERLAEQAVTDALTGLSNNRHFREWMDRETARTRRFGGDLSLILLDIDDFKAVNDTYGHLQGDAVLEMIGRVLRRESRGVDEPARYGGEEFVLALPETPKDGAAEVAERVRESIGSTPVSRTDGSGGSLRVTASIGLATMPEDGNQVQELITAADEALYRAKRAGKNRVELARPAVAVSEAAQGNPGGRRS